MSKETGKLYLGSDLSLESNLITDSIYLDIKRVVVGSYYEDVNYFKRHDLIVYTNLEKSINFSFDLSEINTNISDSGEKEFYYKDSFKTIQGLGVLSVNQNEVKSNLRRSAEFRFTKIFKYTTFNGVKNA